MCCRLAQRTRHPRPDGIRNTFVALPGQADLWTGHTVFVSSESVQKFTPSFRVSMKRSFGQQGRHEHGLRLDNKALRLAESTMASRPSGETDSWASNDVVWICCMPSAEACAPRIQERRPCKRMRIDPPGDDSEDIDFQHPSGYIMDLIGKDWAGFTVFFSKHDNNMENKGRYGAGQPLQEDPETSGHARTAKPLPSPPEPSKAEVEAHRLTHLPHKRGCPICVRAKGKERLHTSTSDSQRTWR